MTDIEDAYDAINEAFDSPAVIVTAADGEESAGCIVGFHAQCSIDPRRHAVWLSKANRTYRVARGSSHLAVHVPGPGDERLAEWFGGTSGDDVDTFAGLDVDPGPGGVPLLRDLPVHFVGRRIALVETDGDHDCFVLEVVEAAAPGAGEGSASGPGDDDEVTPLRIGALGDVEPGHASEEGAEE